MDISQRIIRTAVDWSAEGIRLADFLSARFTYRSREEWAERIGSGEITLNGEISAADTVLQLHDIIEYRPADIVEPAAATDYKTVFEDEHLLVIDKPGNLCMHPAGPFFKNTLWHMLCTKYDKKIHFINRLDRETSGLLLAAKNAQCAKKIAAAKSISAKKYMVVVHGDFQRETTAEGFLVSADSVVHKKRKFVTEMPKAPPFESALTTFRKIGYANGLSLLEAELGTGRMHQIRATLHSLGHPVAGDKLYGLDETLYLRQRTGELSDEDMKKLMIRRQALHSCELIFTHPYNGQKMLFTSPLPEEIENLIKQKE